MMTKPYFSYNLCIDLYMMLIYFTYNVLNIVWSCKLLNQVIIHKCIIVYIYVYICIVFSEIN